MAYIYNYYIYKHIYLVGHKVHLNFLQHFTEKPE